jgi:hypothetical protein
MMTWFSNSVAERALTLITQHMRDCEIDKKEIKDALKSGAVPGGTVPFDFRHKVFECLPLKLFDLPGGHLASDRR